MTTSSTSASGVVEWLSNDPIGISGGLNQFVFCGNNPVNFTDPFGLYQYTTANPFLGFLHQMNPFNMDGSLNAQFAAAWALGMGDTESAMQWSGQGQLDEECAGKGWKYAYWGAIGISAAADITAGALIGLEAAGVSEIGSANIGWRGGEITFTRPGAPTPDWRFNPFGGSGYGPHYHRRGPGGIGRHRPWQPGPGGFPGRF